MEQKRILWIVAAVGIFLLVVVGFTLILYAPQSATDPVMAVASLNNTWVNPSAGMVSNNSETPSQVEENLQDSVESLELTTAIPSTITVDTTVISTASSALTANTLQTSDLTVISSGNTTVYAADGVTTIDLATTTEANTVQAPTTSSSVAQIEKAVTTFTATVPLTNSTAPEASSTTPPEASSTTPPKASSTTTRKPAPVKAAVATLTVPKKPIDQYWVQAASFISKANAEDARSSLSRERIPAEVFTYDDATGITYYRLRVGPYTTKSEAEYWNSLIKLIDNFATTQSYVTNSTAPQA